MRLNSRSFARYAVIVLLIPVLAGCQKQNNAQRPAQQAHEKFAGAGHEKLRVACADEIQKFCANADRKRRCLRENMDKLSDACKTAVAQRGGRRARDNNGGDE